MQFEIINAIGTAILEYFGGQIVGIIIGVIGFLLFFAMNPRISFYWAKKTFGLRRGRTTFTATALSTFVFSQIYMDMDQLKKSLEQTGAFERIESVMIDSDKQIQLHSNIDGNSIIQNILPIENEDEELIGVKGTHSVNITYGGIGDFVDLAISGRLAIERGLKQLSLILTNTPDIVVHLSWDSSTLSILPWLKKKYTFDGAIFIDGTSISILHSENGASVKSDGPSPVFKEIIRNLIVDNLTK